LYVVAIVPITVRCTYTRCIAVPTCSLLCMDCVLFFLAFYAVGLRVPL